MKKIIILGLGNILMRDEGTGVALLQELLNGGAAEGGHPDQPHRGGNQQ